MHDEPLSYHVELWAPSGDTVERILGQAGTMLLATAIFQAALQEYPGRLVTLSHGGQRLRPGWDEPSSPDA